jgi:hypothetical protein
MRNQSPPFYDSWLDPSMAIIPRIFSLHGLGEYRENGNWTWRTPHNGLFNSAESHPLLENPINSIKQNSI